MLGLVGVILFSLIGVRLWLLQTVKADELQQLSTIARTRTVRIPPERGRIFDVDGRILADNQRILTVAVDWQQLRKRTDRLEIFRRLSAWVGVPIEARDINDLRTVADHDGLGYLTGVRSFAGVVPRGDETTVTYAGLVPAGDGPVMEIRAETDGHGHVVSEFDRLGRAVTERELGLDSVERYVALDYDARGRLRATSLPTPVGQAPVGWELLDYDFLRTHIMALVRDRHINLQETLCQDIYAMCMGVPQVSAARVATRKPEAYPDCEAVGYELSSLP